MDFLKEYEFRIKNHGDNRISSLRKPLKHHEKSPRNLKVWRFFKGGKILTTDFIIGWNISVVGFQKILRKQSLDKFESKSGIITTLVKFPLMLKFSD